MMEWLDIETAPKTQEMVLLWTPMHVRKRGYFLPLTGYFSHDEVWLIVNADAAVQRVYPTHWMPLPPAPHP